MSVDPSGGEKDELVIISMCTTVSRHKKLCNTYMYTRIQVKGRIRVSAIKGGTNINQLGFNINAV